MIAAAICLGAALLAGLVGIVIRHRADDMADTTTAACGDVAAGGFTTRPCEVTGTVDAGGNGDGTPGRIAAPISRTECVWYRTRLTRRYWTREAIHGDKGQITGHRKVEHDEVLSDEHSHASIVVADATGRIRVDLDGSDVDRPELVVDRFDEVEHEASEGLVDWLADRIAEGFKQSDTIGYRREEWVLRPGTPIYVLGQASCDASGATAHVHAPEHGRFVVSTRSEADLVRSAQAGGTVAFVIGAALVVASAVAAIVSR